MSLPYRLLGTVWYYLGLIPTWLLLTLHNSWGIVNVFYITWLRPMRGGIVSAQHPYATAINPQTGKPIWYDNILYRSDNGVEYGVEDDEIIRRTGEYMRLMFCKCVATNENPHGSRDRMPPSINYIHGCVHYNAGYIILDDIADCYRHFSSLEFRLSLWKFILRERREPVLVLRDREYDRKELLQVVCFLRSIFPYFANSNGNRKRIGWGNPAPFPSINIITGHWKRFVYSFYTDGAPDRVALPPIKRNYFTRTSYDGGRREPRMPERILATLTDLRVRFRGERGNLFFVDARKVESGYRFDPAAPPNLTQRIKEKVLR